MKELWTPVIGAEGFYEVSNLGQVRSVDRIVHYSDGRSRHYEGGLLSQGKDERGYYLVGFNMNGKNFTVRVHRLVATAFIPCNDDSLEVNHIDGIKSNNKAGNLEWVTSSENTIKGYELGLFDRARKLSSERMSKANRYHKSKRAKVTDLETGETIIFNSLKEAGNHYGFADNTFSESLRVRDGIVKKRYKVEKVVK